MECKDRGGAAVMVFCALAACAGCPRARPLREGAPRITSRQTGALADESDDEAISRNPNDVGAFLARGPAYQRTGHYDRAIADFTKVIELPPEPSAGGYSARGDCHAAKSDSDRAIAYHTTALALDPNCVHAYLVRGTLLAQIRRD